MSNHHNTTTRGNASRGHDDGHPPLTGEFYLIYY